MTNKENHQNNIEMLESASSFKIKTNQNGFSPRLTENTANDLFPSLTQKPPLSTLLEKRVSPQQAKQESSSNFNSFQIGSSYLKDNLSKKGRCPICTLPIPCKHYESIDDLPKIQNPLYSLPPSNNGNHTELSIYKRSHKTTRESSIPSQPQNQNLENMGNPVRRQSDLFKISSPPKPLMQIDSDFNRQLPQISPRTSQLDSFLNQGLKVKKAKGNANDFNLFYGKSNTELTPKEAQLRIRGKSNILQTQEGSLLYSIYEQKQEQEREKQLKQAKKRIKLLNKLEEFRHRKLIDEIERIEEEKRQQEKEIRMQKHKEAQRQKYLAEQKAKLDLYQMEKTQKLMVEEREYYKKVQNDKFQELKKKEYFEDQKAKIKLFKEKKKELQNILNSEAYDDSFLNDI